VTVPILLGASSDDRTMALRWESVDLKTRQIRLGSTKNGKPRALALTGELSALVERRWRHASTRPPPALPFRLLFSIVGTVDRLRIRLIGRLSGRRVRRLAWRVARLTISAARWHEIYVDLESTRRRA
jgi:hypothetical protein